MPEPKSVTREEAARTPRGAELPPAGHGRDEVLRERADTLAEAAESTGRERFNPAKLDPINEIASKIVGTSFNSLHVSGALADKVYCWVRAYDDRGTYKPQAVYAKQLQRVPDADGTPRPCWEVVHGSMPEALECKSVEGYRKLGDCILMRCDKDVYEAIRRLEDADRAERNGLGGTLGTTADMLAQSKLRGSMAVTEFNNDPREEMRLRHMAHREQAMRGPVTQALKNGTVPGLRAPGR